MKRTLLLFLFALSLRYLGWGQYSGTGTFNKITSLTDLTDGYYVVVNSGDGYAMNNTNTGSYFDRDAITPLSGVISNPDTKIVWKIETNGSGRSIYNEASSKYVSYSGSSNAAYAVDAVSSNNQRWTFTYASNVFSVANLAVTNRILQYNASSPRFACYTTSQQKFLLYKMADAPAPEPTNHPTTFAATPNSTSQITVTWVDATGTQLPENYLVKAAVSPASPAAPADGTPEVNGTLVKNVAQGTQQAVFSGLNEGATYNFSIWPYTNSGSQIDYKLGSQPTASATTNSALTAPVAIAASAVKTTGFTANWDGVGGATSYRLDVSDQPTFATAGGTMTDLIISEYIDGNNGTNKAIEIYNGTGSDVSLINYRIWMVNNGGTWPETVINLPDETLSNGDVYVVIHSSSDFTNLISVDDLTSGSFGFNGDDAIGIAKNISGTWTLIDAVGEDGSDPGSGWSVAGTFDGTVDNILRRKSTVSSPNTDWDASRGTNVDDSEWIVISPGSNTNASGFGSHTFSGGSTPSFITGYNDLTVGSTSQVVSGLTYGTTYYYRVRATDGSATTGNSNTIAVTTASSTTFTGTANWTADGNWSAGVPSGADALVSGTVTINDLVECNNLTIAPGGAVTVGASQGLSVNGNMLIQSDASGTGSFIGDADDYDITGTVTVQRYINGAADAWHLLSSPVSGQAISGAWTPSGSYPDGSGYDLYAYDEATNTYVNRKNTIASPVGEGPRFDDASVNNGFNFLAGKGYMCAYETVGTAKIFSGTLNEGIFYTDLSKVGTSAYAGANLVGNPYPSSIDWKASPGVDLSGVRTETGGGKQFYTWNEVANNYGVYNSQNSGDGGTNGASRYIAPMQAFWVMASTHGGDLGFDNDSRVHSSQAWQKAAEATNPALVIRATAPGQNGYDEAMVEFNHESSVGGATKKFSFVATAPSLYLEKEAEKFSISFLTDVATNPEIPVSFKAGIDGSYTLAATRGLESFGRVTLHDFATGYTQELLQNPVYTFTASVTDAPNRFKLTFGAVGIETPVASPVSVYTYANRLHILNAGSATVEIISMAGQVVERFGVNETGAFSRPMNLKSGAYVVRVVNGTSIRTQRIVIN